MNWCKISSNSYLIDYNGKVFKLTFENEKRAILEVKETNSLKFEKLDYIEGDNKNEVLNNALNYIKILYPGIKFDHNKDSLVEALGLSKNDLMDIVKNIGISLKETKSKSEVIEKLYETYSNDISRLIIAMIYLGIIMEELNAMGKLHQFINDYNNTTWVSRINELLSENSKNMENQKKIFKKPWDDDMGYIQ